MPSDGVKLYTVVPFSEYSVIQCHALHARNTDRRGEVSTFDPLIQLVHYTKYGSLT
jgi:hypothetical protein